MTQMHLPRMFLRCFIMLLAALGSQACGLFREKRSDAQDRGLPTNACWGNRCAVSMPVASFANCPTGACDPGNGNGKGIYIASESDYCLKDEGDVPRYCPETFIHDARGVALQLRDFKNTAAVYTSPVQAVLVNASGTEEPVTLVSLRGERTELAITYRTSNGQVRTAKGSEVGSVRLKLTVSRGTGSNQQLHGFELQVRPVAPNPDLPPWFRRYWVTYRPSGTTSWKPYCLIGRNDTQTSFLSGKRISGLTAEVTNDESVTTMSCETGAVDACLLWGYTPWSPQTGNPEASEYLFRSCLQAKRAAYFVGRGDSNSYTKSGTMIVKRDPYGISKQQVPHVEAIWSPRGAECLNPEYRRFPELALPDTLPADLPACKPAQWSEYGKLATGKAP
jgi:hypothetical protein